MNVTLGKCQPSSLPFDVAGFPNYAYTAESRPGASRWTNTTDFCHYDTLTNIILYSQSEIIVYSSTTGYVTVYLYCNEDIQFSNETAWSLSTACERRMSCHCR